eukprot:12736849-Alexandrium_andersonii.AAC.1
MSVSHERPTPYSNLNFTHAVSTLVARYLFPPARPSGVSYMPHVPAEFYMPPHNLSHLSYLALRP